MQLSPDQRRMYGCTCAKLSSRSVIHDSAGSAGRTMAEDLENPEDKVRDNTISVRRSKQFMRTVTAPARSPRRTSHRLHSHRLCGGCAASRAPATHGRGNLGPSSSPPPLPSSSPPPPPKMEVGKERRGHHIGGELP